MILSLISILLYYPAATLIYPLVQYTNKGVELKYDENFLVFLIQTKLIIAALSIFLKTGPDIMIKLIIVFFLMIGLAVFSYKYQPCLLKFANKWHTMGYLICAWVIYLYF